MAWQPFARAEGPDKCDLVELHHEVDDVEDVLRLDSVVVEVPARGWPILYMCLVDHVVHVALDEVVQHQHEVDDVGELVVGVEDLLEHTIGDDVVEDVDVGVLVVHLLQSDRHQATPSSASHGRQRDARLADEAHGVVEDVLDCIERLAGHRRLPGGVGLLHVGPADDIGARCPAGDTDL